MNRHKGLTWPVWIVSMACGNYQFHYDDALVQREISATMQSEFTPEFARLVSSSGMGMDVNTAVDVHLSAFRGEDVRVSRHGTAPGNSSHCGNAASWSVQRCRYSQFNVPCGLEHKSFLTDCGQSLAVDRIVNVIYEHD